LKISPGAVKGEHLTTEEIQIVLTAFRPTLIVASGRLFRRCGRQVGRTNRDVPDKKAPNEPTRRTPALMVFEWIVSFPVAYLRYPKCTTHYITLSSIKEASLVREPPLLDIVDEKRRRWLLAQCQQPALHPELNV